MVFLPLESSRLVTGQAAAKGRPNLHREDSMPTATYVEAIPLSDAVFCADCECIATIEDGKCANCQSSAIQWLHKWLNRTKKSPRS